MVFPSSIAVWDDALDFSIARNIHIPVPKKNRPTNVGIFWWIWIDDRLDDTFLLFNWCLQKTNLFITGASTFGNRAWMPGQGLVIFPRGHTTLADTFNPHFKRSV